METGKPIKLLLFIYQIFKLAAFFHLWLQYKCLLKNKYTVDLHSIHLNHEGTFNQVLFYDIDTCWYMGMVEQSVQYLLQKLVGAEMWEVEDYKDMQHGWVTRGDLKVTIYNWT